MQRTIWPEPVMAVREKDGPFDLLMDPLLRVYSRLGASTTPEKCKLVYVEARPFKMAMPSPRMRANSSRSRSW